MSDNSKIVSAAYKDFVYAHDSEKDGLRILKYTGSSDTVEIPAEINGEKVVSLGAYVFVDIDDVGEGKFKADVAKNAKTTPREIILPPQLEYISYCAFYGCENIKSMIIPESVTEIGSSAFAFCRSLGSIRLPSGISILNRSMFRNCDSLKEAVITGNVDTIGFIAFENCGALENVVLPESVKSIEMRAFCGCRSLKGIKLPDNDIVFGNGAFAESGLIEITILCSSFISEAMFHNCIELESVRISRGLKEIRADAFNGCISLGSVHFNDGVRMIGNRAFCGCEALESLSPVGADTVYGKDVWKDTNFC